MTSLRLRRIVLGAAFLGASMLVVVLNRGQPATDAALAPGFSLQNVASELGINFVHHRPSLDPRLDNVAPLVAAMGASVSVTDANNDGWPDLYFTNSRFGFPNALYINRGGTGGGGQHVQRRRARSGGRRREPTG